MIFVSGRITLGFWVGNPNKADDIHHKETQKQAVLIINHLNLVQKVLHVGPMFEVVPIGFKHSASSSCFMTGNSFKARFMISRLDNISM